MFCVLEGPACHGFFGIWENHVDMAGSWKLIVKHVYFQRITEHSKSDNLEMCSECIIQRTLRNKT